MSYADLGREELIDLMREADADYERLRAKLDESTDYAEELSRIATAWLDEWKREFYNTPSYPEPVALSPNMDSNDRAYFLLREALAKRSPEIVRCEHKWATDGLGPTQCVRCGEISGTTRSPAVGNLEREVEVLRYERDRAEAQREATLRILVRIHDCLAPPVFTDKDGKTFRYVGPDMTKLHQLLSDRIREIPDELDRAGLRESSQGTAEALCPFCKKPGCPPDCMGHYP